MEMTYKRLIGLILILILLGGVPSATMAADTIKIGLLTVLSGPLESTGRFVTAAVQFVADEYNEKGGLFGKKIEIIAEDHEWKGDAANRKGKKLIMIDKVDILYTVGSSPAAIAVTKLATDNKILHFHALNTAHEVQGKDFSRYSFRVFQNAYNMFAGMAVIMANTSYRRPYILCPDVLAGHSHSDGFKDALGKRVRDAKIAGEDYPPLGTKDFAPYITKIIASKADVVMLGLFGPDFPTFVKQSRSLGLKAPFPMFTILGDPYQMNELRDDSVGLTQVLPYELSVKTPENQEMLRRWHEKHKNDKDYLTWWPFGDCGGVLSGCKMAFAAMEKAGSTDPEKVIPVFEGFQYKTPAGLWTMRKCDHQALMPMYGSTIQAGSNPYYNGSIRPDVNFPWYGPNYITVPADQAALPATPDYSPRCP